MMMMSRRYLKAKQKRIFITVRAYHEAGLSTSPVSLAA